MTPKLPTPQYQFTPGWSDFTSDWWSMRIPQWETYVKPQIEKTQGPVKALEVGSYEGRSALYMLENLLQNHAQSRLTCIDIWSNVEVEKRFDRNIASCGLSNKIVKVKGDAFDCLRSLPRESRFDLAYVDADHVGKSALTQAAMIWPLLKVGGVLVFDDYPWKDPNPTKEKPPKPGIDAFLDLWEGHFLLLHKAWQVILLKTR